MHFHVILESTVHHGDLCWRHQQGSRFALAKVIGYREIDEKRRLNSHAARALLSLVAEMRVRVKFLCVDDGMDQP